MRGFCRSLVVLLTMFSMSLAWSGETEASEPLSIRHSVQTYSNDGPTMTVTLNIEVQNTQGGNINELTLTLPSRRKARINPLAVDAPVSVSVGSLAPGQITNTTVTLTSYTVFPQEEIITIPVLWEIDYLNDAGQKVILTTESYGAN